MYKISRKIDDIELLRGVGALFVLVGHAHKSLITWTTPAIERFYSYFFGASGVDLFFAISGFVIVRDLHPKLAACKDFQSFANVSLAFWIRRIWRIFPSAWVWLGVILACTAFFNNSGAFRSLDAAIDGTIAGIFQYYNYRLAICHRHFDCGANFYYWTLSLEEQFYFILPLAVFLSRRWFPYWVAALILFQIVFPNRPPMMTVFRTDALLMGALIALWSVKPSYKIFEARVLSRHRLRIAIVLCLFATLAIDQKINVGKLGAFSYGVIAVICGGLVLVGSYNKDYLMPKNPIKNLLMWLGSRSCSMYLAHIPVYYANQEIWYRITPPETVYGPQYIIPFMLTAVAMLLLLTELSYRLIEAPTRKKGTEVSQHFLQRRMPAEAMNR